MRCRLAGIFTGNCKIGSFAWSSSVCFFNQQFPDPNNRVTIDPQRTDLLGNHFPILNYSYADYSLDGGLAAIRAGPQSFKGRGSRTRQTFRLYPAGFSRLPGTVRH